MAAKRVRLIGVRKAAGYTQEQLAEAMHIDRSTVVRWESGDSEPLPYKRPKLAKLLGVSRDQLAVLLAPHPTVTAVDVMEPQTPPNMASDSGDLDAIATAAAYESLRFANRATESSTSNDLLEHLRWEISRLAVDYVHTPVRALFRDLIETRNTVFDLLDKRQRPHHLHDLYFLGATACLLLAHASQNVGNQRAALAQLRTARTCADMADHDALRAWSQGTAALIDEWSPHQSKAVESARRGIQFPASQESHIRLAAIESRAAARMGNRVRARDALTRLRTLQDATVSPDDVIDLGGLLSFPKAKQHYYIGSTYSLLGDHELAEQHAQTAINAYENGLPAERSYGDETLARLDVVNARLSLGDLDGATDAVAPVLALPEDRRISQLTTAIDRTRGILQQPQFTRSSASRELLDSLRHYRDQVRTNPQALPSP